MSLIFTQPWGWLALLGWPIVIWIHWLKQLPKKEKTHVLFLLERVPHVEQTGKSISKWQSSWPFWLQMLMVLLISVYLAEPRWQQVLKSYRVVVVLDDSASMAAFRPEIAAWANRQEGIFSSFTHETWWQVISSKDSGRVYYTGNQLKPWASELKDWQPVEGPHDVEASFHVARKLAGEEGQVIFVTDHPPESISVPWISLGQPKANAGLYGFEAVVDVEKPVWKWTAILKNQSDEAMQREWEITDEHGKSFDAKGKQSVQLQPREGIRLEGTLPLDQERAWLKLQGDDFTLDDALPMQRPNQEVLFVKDLSSAEKGRRHDLLALLKGVSHVREAVEQSPHLLLVPLGTQVTSDAIQFAESEESPLVSGAMYLVEKHALTRDLQFMGLITPEPAARTLHDQDEVLVWKGDAPLIFLRQENSHLRLVLNWSLVDSNYRYHPDVLVLLYRFTLWVGQRAQLRVEDNFEMGQLSILPMKDAMNLKLNENDTKKFLGHAPKEVGFFEVNSQNGKLVLRGSSQFGEIRESDLSQAQFNEDSMKALQRTLTSQISTHAPSVWWIGSVLLGALLLSWVLARPKTLGFKSKAMESAVKGGVPL